MRIGAHAARPLRSEVGQLGSKPAVVVEKLRRSVALHPLFKKADMGGVLVHLAHWHLMRAPVILGTLAIDFFWTSPALGSAQYDHRPARALPETISPCIRFDALNFTDSLVQGSRHQRVHFFRFTPLNKIG